MNSRVIAAIAAAVLAAVGIGAVYAYASGANSRAFDNAALVGVYRVTGEIGANASAEDVQAKVETVRVPKAAIPSDAVTSLSNIQGLKTTVPLVTGEILSKSRFSESGSSGTAGSAVPKGLQEVTIALGADAAGNVAAGQRVGIILTAEGDGAAATRMFAQSVLVTNVSEGDNKLVTFAASGKLATQIAAAAQGGTIRLTIQNDDTNKDGGDSVKAPSLVK